MVLTGFVMTEVAAYPAFLWAILGLQLAIAAPSPRRDLLAVAALALAAARANAVRGARARPPARDPRARDRRTARSIGGRSSRRPFASHRCSPLLYAPDAVAAGDRRRRRLARRPPRRVRGHRRGRVAAAVRHLVVGGAAPRRGRDRVGARPARPRRRLDARDASSGRAEAGARAGDAVARHDRAADVRGRVVQRALRRRRSSATATSSTSSRCCSSARRRRCSGSARRTHVAIGAAS